MTDDIRELFNTADLEVKVPTIGSTLERGRKLKVRRRIAGAVAAASGVILVGVSGYMLVGQDPTRKVINPISSPSPTVGQPIEANSISNDATEALNRGDLEEAEELGRQRLEEASDERHWDYGNAVHQGHLILGHVALRRGDIVEAKRELLEAGATPGSPQLNSFGPNMTLARDLLLYGEKDIVLAYIKFVRRFWVDSKLVEWEGLIETGIIPEFGAHLLYGDVSPSPACSIHRFNGC